MTHFYTFTTGSHVYPENNPAHIRRETFTHISPRFSKERPINLKRGMPSQFPEHQRHRLHSASIGHGTEARKFPFGRQGYFYPGDTPPEPMGCPRANSHVCTAIGDRAFCTQRHTLCFCAHACVHALSSATS